MAITTNVVCTENKRKRKAIWDKRHKNADGIIVPRVQEKGYFNLI